MMISSMLGFLWDFVVHTLWTSFLYLSCGFILLGYFVYSLECFMFNHLEIYGSIFSLIRCFKLLLPALPNYDEHCCYLSNLYISSSCKGVWQYNPCFSWPPSCTSGWHAQLQHKFLYWRHHLNSSFGSWYKTTPPTSPSKPSPTISHVPPWWWHTWEYFALLQSTIISLCWTHLHFKWWTRLCHHLVEFLVHFPIIYSRFLSLLQSSCIFTSFGFDDNLYWIYCTDLWRNVPVFGNNTSWILTATIDDSGSRSVDCRKPKCSTVLFLPSFFNIPSSQQIWPYVCCSAESRSGVGGSEFIQQDSMRNSQLSMLTLIMDSGANLSLFNNKSLLERLITSPFHKKKIHSVHTSKKFYQKGTRNIPYFLQERLLLLPHRQQYVERFSWTTNEFDDIDWDIFCPVYKK